MGQFLTTIKRTAKKLAKDEGLDFNSLNSNQRNTLIISALLLELDKKENINCKHKKTLCV